MYFCKWLSKYSFVMAFCWFPMSASVASMCSDYEPIKTFMEKGNYQSALQEMDKCLRALKQPSADDQRFLVDLVKQLRIASNPTSLEDAYRNFQSILKIHLFDGLKFEFAPDFKAHPKQKLFAEVRKAGEKYYFYYDTGRVLSHSRGIALTSKSLIWKNLIGEPNRVEFNDIKTITLVYERGLSLTGWKLQVNSGNKDRSDIRLSSVPNEALIPFALAIIYFIDANKTSPDKSKIQFNVPEREKGILAGWVTLCSKEYVDQGAPIKKLPLLDACFSKYYNGDFKLSVADSVLLNKLTTSIFENVNNPFTKGYNNFKIVLSTHFFNGLKFKFKNNLDGQIQANIFPDIRHRSEKYFFYFDNGTVTCGSRGVALTDKAILWKNFTGSKISWKNLTGSASRLPFDKISSVTLAHEIDFSSLTGWKLRLNKNEKYEIVLSKLSTENVELFASALVYYINLVRKDAQLTLQIPAETRDILTKSFLERHPKLKSMTDSVSGLF